MSITFTPLAKELLATVSSNKLNLSTEVASLLVPISYNADIFDAMPRIITADYGFEGYIGVPGMSGTDAASQAAATS